jgi:hypothetical protein
VKTSNQYDRILRCLKRGWTSPAKAFAEAGTLKLATRVGELRKQGHRISDRWSEKGRFKEYRSV